MAGGWKIVVEVCLPVPIILLVLMCLPAPRTFHRAVLAIVDRTLGLTFVGSLSLLHIMLGVTGTCFLASIRTSTTVLSTKPLTDEASPNVIAGHMGKRWRAERNFWISFICFFLWCLLARFFQIMKAQARIEDEARYLRNRDAASSTPDVVEPKKAI